MKTKAALVREINNLNDVVEEQNRSLLLAAATLEKIAGLLRETAEL